MNYMIPSLKESGDRVPLFTLGTAILARMGGDGGGEDLKAKWD